MALRRLGRLGVAALALSALAGPALAHGGGLAGAGRGRLAVPTWLFLLTGGGVIGASFLLSGFATDRAFLDYVHGLGRRLSLPRDALHRVGQAAGVGGLALVVAAGFLGPPDALSNAAILLVWVGWWAGYVMSLYLLGGTWRSVDPFRTLASPLGSGRFDYPDRLGSWPAVVGLLALIWLEVVSPLADDPRFLAAAALAYLGVGLAGSAAFGVEDWFGRADPVACAFRQYGRVAPVRRTDDGLVLGLPGSGLTESVPRDRSVVGLVLAIVWGTTFDGFVGTGLWSGLARGLAGAGVPPAVLYPLALGAGYLAFLGAFLLAARVARRVAPTYLTAGALARLFAPSLLAIAAGYHLAHYLGYFLALSPSLLAGLLHPFGGFQPTRLVLPGWAGALPVVFVLLGHVLAVWVAHKVAYDAFPSRLQAVRSQYPVTVAMVLYTMVSLWVVTQPYTAPPYV